MFESIALSVIKAIASYLFSGYMKNHFGSIEIEGAPSWYEKENNNEICVSDAKKGDITFIDKEKKLIKIKLQKKLSKILNSAIYTNKKFSNLTKDEREFLNKIIYDKNLKWFIEKNGYYKNIKFDKDMIFIRMCIDKEKFLNYEKKRIKELQKEILNYKLDKNIKELEENTTPLNNDPQSKAFRELENF